MCSPEEEGLQLCCGLLRSFCSQFSEGWPSSGPHAGAQGACVRARSGACCGASCAAGLLAPLSAIFWPGSGYACRWPLEPAPLRCGVFSQLRVHAFVFLRPASSWGFPQIRVHPMRKAKSAVHRTAHTTLRLARLIAASGRFAAVQWSQWLSFFTGEFDHR